MYRIAYVPVGHHLHSREDKFEEAHVFLGDTRVETFKGPRAKLEARGFIDSKNWEIAA